MSTTHEPDASPDAGTPDTPGSSAPAVAHRDPVGTRRDILEAAIEEFSARGLLGARIDSIAERTRTTKRMIYYYFTSKEQLYAAALIDSYRRIREREVQLHLDDVEPAEALRRLVRATLDHHENNPAFVRLVSFENTLPSGAIHLMSDEVRELNRTVLLILDDVLRRGRESGVFRAGPGAPSALDVHQILSALSFNRVANRSTFREIFDRDMTGEKDSPHVRALVEDTVLRLALADPR